MARLTIVKVGGKVVENPAALQNFLDEFRKITGNKILVHGGGQSATNLSDKLGIKTVMVEGRRITDEQTLEVAAMVYGGLINKKIVAQLQARAINAIGLTGADLDLVRARKRALTDIDYGFVGDVESINSRELRLLFNENVVPVIAPLTHDGNGQLLNTNADTIASALAVEFSDYFNVFLFYCFDKRGVLTDPENDNSLIRELSYELFQEFKQTGIVSAGMIPKLDNGYNALRNGVKEVLITNAETFSKGIGTRLVI